MTPIQVSVYGERGGYGCIAHEFVGRYDTELGYHP